MNLFVMLAFPLLAALLCWRARTPGIASGATLASCIAVLVLAIDTAFAALRGGTVVGVEIAVAADALSALMLLLIAVVATGAAFFSRGYMQRMREGPARLWFYYLNFNLFVFSMLAVPLLVEPTLVWIFVELTTLCSAMLVGYENTREALEAAWKYVALSLMGAAIGLLGFLVLFAAMQAAGGGTYTWEGLVQAAPRMPPALIETAFLLVLVGFGTKVGLVPLHTWLPDAHSQAPSPVCAVLSGVETTVILYVILRMLPVLDAVPGVDLQLWTVSFGLLSVGVAAFLLIQVRDYKRMFAYSTVEHMGIILVAAGLGSAAANYSTVYQALTHTLTKSFCFYAAGAALLATGSRDILAQRGLIRRSPATGASLLIGGLAIAGAPPFAVFLSEFSIFRAGLAEGRYIAIGLLVLFIAIGFFAVMRHVNRMVFGAAAGAAEPFRLPASCAAVLVVAAALVIVSGLYLPPPLHELLQRAAARMAG